MFGGEDAAWGACSHMRTPLKSLDVEIRGKGVFLGLEGSHVVGLEARMPFR
jgi:hypothetical protein